MAELIVEICPVSGDASLCTQSGESVEGTSFESDIRDCNASGDAEPALQYVLDNIGVEFRIVARDANGKYENRLATSDEKQATCESIYFDSDADFSDETRQELYLLWQVASELE
jgi:hypothetical protein